MPIDNQDEAIEFVQSPGVVGAGAADQRMVVTLISVVVLAGTRAFKLKRAVTLPYLDFSTPERRLAACKQELALNARTAPGFTAGFTGSRVSETENSPWTARGRWSMPCWRWRASSRAGCSTRWPGPAN
ncbi:hypothetical protein [Oleomonas cavernae]|nr:hypothetical protein [Oleomonas cavernae]